MSSTNSAPADDHQNSDQAATPMDLAPAPRRAKPDEALSSGDSVKPAIAAAKQKTSAGASADADVATAPARKAVAKTAAREPRKSAPAANADMSASQSAGSERPAGEPRATTTRDVADAFLVARKKMSAGVVDTAVSKTNKVAKGVVEVSDRKLKRTAGEDQAVASAPVIDEAPRPVAAAPAPVAPVVAKPVKPVAATKGQGFKTLEYIVYPAHGVGQIVAVEEQVVAGYKLELFVISFVKDKMILKVPLPKIASVGMRKLAEPPVVKRALDTLTGRARVKRTMWSRRAQEYEAKINSGDLVAIAEVVRDLYRSDAQPEQSYSERQLYEAALDRIARELAVVEKLTDTEALKLIEAQLQKGPRRGKVEDAAGDSDDGEGEGEEEGVGEAA